MLAQTLPAPYRPAIGASSAALRIRHESSTLGPPRVPRQPGCTFARVEGGLAELGERGNALRQDHR